MQLTIQRMDGGERTLSVESIDQLTAEMRGKLICSADADFDDVRKIWNGMIDYRPAPYTVNLTPYADLDRVPIALGVYRSYRPPDGALVASGARRCRYARACKGD